LILLDEGFEILGLTLSIVIYSVEAVAAIVLLFQRSLRNLIVNFFPCFVLVILILHWIFLASVLREHFKSLPTESLKYSTVVLSLSTDILERSHSVNEKSLSKVIIVFVIAEPLSVVGATILSFG